MIIKNPDGTIAVSITPTKYPEKPTSGESLVVTKGTVFEFEGSYYVAANTETFNEHYYRKPSDTDPNYFFKKLPKESTLISTDPFPNGSLEDGMVCKADGNYYLRITGGEHGTIPSGDGDGNWLKINTV